MWEQNSYTKLKDNRQNMLKFLFWDKRCDLKKADFEEIEMINVIIIAMYRYSSLYFAENLFRFCQNVFQHQKGTIFVYGNTLFTGENDKKM